uniref:G-protein coupled receptors family 1 profile domain-containing protein n=1 Tax=Bos mutus grunniens TaxID=30521 RepID=A0A8B9WHP0_BOSMU
MAKGNYSAVSEFILLGLTDNPELQATLFGVFLVIYFASILGNLGLIVLIQVSPQLHTPMYFFLSHLAFIDFSFTSSVTPNTLVNFLCEVKSITFYACVIQVCCFITSVACEQYLLSVMAYDRSFATLYSMPSSCLKSSVIGPFFSVAFLHTVVTFRLIYCGPNAINHFYCDDVPLMALACSDTSLKEILIFIFAGFNMISSLTTVLISYLYFVAAILRIQSAEGRRKASSTCGSHLTAVTVFYGTLIFMYLQPKSNHSLDTDKMASVFYTIVILMLNPMIYSLRNQEVKNALRKAFEKCYFLSLIYIRM